MRHDLADASRRVCSGCLHLIFRKNAASEDAPELSHISHAAAKRI